jgi:hypothetical protein
MKIMKYLLGAVMALAVVGCEPFEKDETKSYPELENLTNTVWWSYDKVNDIYYDITYGENGEGVMLGYDEQERVNEVVNRPFSYTFTPATEEINAIVRVDFEDGQHYGGWAAPKGIYQINLQDVYLIQLYEVYENGEVIYNVDGTMKSTLQMWME